MSTTGVFVAGTLVAVTSRSSVGEAGEEIITDEFGMPFRSLSETEEQEFRQWARSTYVAGEPINPLWHPVAREECLEMLGEIQVVRA